MLPHAGGQAARGDTLSPLNKSAASAARADRLQVSAARQSSVLLQQSEACKDSTPAEQRSRKKAKRLFPTDDADAAAHDWPVRNSAMCMYLLPATSD